MQQYAIFTGLNKSSQFEFVRATCLFGDAAQQGEIHFGVWATRPGADGLCVAPLLDGDGSLP